MSQEVVGPLGIAGAFSESLPVSPVEGGGINPALVYLAQLGTAVSRSTMASKLNRFAQWAGFPDLETCRWAMLTPESILAFLSVLEHEGRKPSTLNCYLASLKGVAKSAWLCKAMSHERYLRIAAIKQRRYYRLPAGRALTHEESRALLEDCEDDTPIGRRDALVLGLMLGCGLRRSEVASLRWDDYDQASSSFTVVGKGDKERRVFLPQAVRILLERYIVDVRGVEPGHLFGRMYKNGRIDCSNPLDPSTIGRITAGRMASANDAPASAHDLRRTFATRLLSKNVDIVTVKNLMGHASITTTALYDRRGEDAMKEAVEEVEI